MLEAGTLYARRLANRGEAIPHVETAHVESSTASSARARDRSSETIGASDAIRPAESEGWTWDRLERAVTLLAEQQVALRGEIASLRSELGERDQRVRRLEAKLLEANQRRQDTGKRIDELISQLDQLDAQLASVEPGE